MELTIDGSRGRAMQVQRVEGGVELSLVDAGYPAECELVLLPEHVQWLIEALRGERMATVNPATTTTQGKSDPMLQWFVFDHLPSELQAVSAPFSGLAEYLVDSLPSNPERTVALRKLLEAKDSAVRARLYKA